MATENINSESREKAVLSDALVLPLRVIDLDSSFFFGVGRDMTDDERKNAERHGRYDNPPMSVLGVTSEGLAAVEGKELAQIFAAAPELLDACMAGLDELDLATSGKAYTPESMQTAIDKMRSAIAKASGQNDAGHAAARGGSKTN